jgi:chromosome segregation ATPase
VKENNSLKESKLNLERDKKIQKILKEENTVVKEDTIKLKKINQLYLETDSKFSIEESKILTTLNIQEKNLKDIEKKLNKVNKSIQLFNSKNERKLNRVQRAIDSQKSFKEKMNTKLIVENQKLALVKSEKKELESTIKDKILDSGLKVQEYENKIKFKSSTSYFSFMKQTLDGTDANDINDNQIAEIINKSVLNDQKTIESLRKELFNDRKDLRKKVESKKISISNIRGKISNLKNQIHDHNKNIKKENRIFDKLIAPNKKLEIEKNQILKEKDVMEKSYIQFQNSEQEKLDQLMAKRKRLKKQHEDNVIGHKAIFESKLNEFKNRIKNHEDLRSLKINQSSRDLNRFLEKADKRLGQIEQLINTGEEVIKELILKIEELTKKRKASSSSIQFSDKKIYVLDNRLEKTKANITSKVRLYRKELEIFNLKIEESSLKKLDLDKEKEALALVLKSFEKKIINIGREPSQIEYDIEQNEKLLNQLKQDDRLKLKREDAIKKNNLIQQNKDINDNLALQRKNLISLKKSLSETLTRINILEKQKLKNYS